MVVVAVVWSGAGGWDSGGTEGERKHVQRGLEYDLFQRFEIEKMNLRTIAEGPCPELNGRKKIIVESIERKRDQSRSQNEGNHTGEAVETGPAIQLQ